MDSCRHAVSLILVHLGKEVDETRRLIWRAVQDKVDIFIDGRMVPKCSACWLPAT